MASSSNRSWRTAFLTLRDETLGSPARSTVVNLLHHLIFSQSQTLIAAAPNLPPHEVTSDVMFLMELARNISDSEGTDETATFTLLSHLIHNLTRRVSLEINSSSWALVLESFGTVVKIFLGKPGIKTDSLGNAGEVEAVKQCLETVRCLINAYQTTCSLSENVQLLNFLLSTVEYSHMELVCSSYSSGNQRYTAEIGRRIHRCTNLWEVRTLAFTMIGEVFSRVGSSFSVEIWLSTVEVLRKVMDVLASPSLLVEDSCMARFYTALLHCLHLVLVDPKGSLSDHVAGFIAALRMFFIYGITKNFQFLHPMAVHEKELSSSSLKSKLAESDGLDCGPYRPPHLRKKDWMTLQQPKAWESPIFSDSESFPLDYASSDSDYSDSDGSARDTIDGHSSKARIAAIVCVQDLCRADRKSFTAQWSMLLPSGDVLKPRKYEATLMACLLFDPHIKARIASASTIATMLDGPTSVFLQVAQYKESTKCGSFTALSNSLGQILMQLHTGILHLIQHETHSGMLASSFKILMLLISSTPYSRMPGELLPTIMSGLQARIEVGFPTRSDQTALLAAAINCLTAALSTTPSSLKVKDMFVAELLTGFVEAQGKSGVLSTIFQYSGPVRSPTISFEALQTLRAVSHNYPTVTILCWEQVSTIVHGFLRLTSPEVPTRPWNGQVVNTTGSMGEKLITAAIKVLDESLRAISGFKGTEDLLDDTLLEAPFTSDYTRIKKISSAPSYESESPAIVKDESETCQTGSEQWCEAIEKHMPLILRHTSSMVRAASVTCFAGITSSVFFSLPKEKQDFIVTSSINAALNDEVPSVRSAACRAIGIITCFPKISKSAEILDKFIHAAELNTCSPSVSVRITASWALANICDSLRHCMNDFPSRGCSTDSKTRSGFIASLMECALRLTKDGDKVKANAVRALGNLSRFVQFTSQSVVDCEPVNGTALSLTNNGAETLLARSDVIDSQGEELLSKFSQSASLEVSYWLERMVQAFLSCVTTGNVKVQWNVCHALSNLFLNGTLKLQDMDWAPSVFSILLLLLRDSSNFKIRIQAAAALAVPATMSDYGRSFSDVVQGIEHMLENISSNQISTPSSFKYRVSLEKQLISTMLHVLGLASGTDHQPIIDFLVKKALFLEDWFRLLCSSLGETSTQLEVEKNSANKQKKEAISKAVQSLIQVYEGRNHHAIVRRLEKLVNSIP